MKLHYGLDELKGVDFMPLLPVILPVIALSTLLVLIALIDLYRHRNTRQNVLMWSFIILLVNTFGPVFYFIHGRKDGEVR
ncbi:MULTISPECIES: PLD nuclease N-terminal domain-containing protein [Bacillaceae]|uniref:PLD nuclease N-terminal domain-containing protein n=1 Tax=Bacillaceae TaxID=186817 RepID=UPI002A1678F7|nr:PLD nuclease N-terminal domain-containing protein [Cytobacillus sp. IB215316]MDX8360996.1 PLD nuclease N-terminal domain-containing protein [Cytobacillus sp. IB215316]